MSNDKRRSYRLPVQGDFAQATLQTARKEWPATLVNESAGGFLVTTSIDSGLKPGDTLTIALYSGSYLVEIVHARTEGEQLHLGARRFDSELQPRPRVAERRGWSRGGMQGPPRPAHSTLLFGAYAGIAILAVVVILGGKGSAVARTLLGKERAADRASAFSSLPTNFNGAIDWRRIQSLHGINSLSSESVRRAIGLSDDQQRSLDLVFTDTGQRLKELFAESENRPADELSRQSSQIIDQAVQRVLCTLTDSQIDRWREELILAAASPR